jgi:hypothetical protein
VISDYVSEYNEEKSEQFSALTLTLNKHEKLVVFSGTDDTIVGWKENFSMLYKSETAAQKRSVKYVERIADTCDKLILAGHSKGGNLATYALYHCKEKAYDKISSVLNFDGPGLSRENYAKKRAVRAKKLKAYCPENSIIGRIFGHNGVMKVVHSSFKGPFQHDLFSWEVERNHFSEAKGFANASVHFEEKLRIVLDKMSDEDRERFAKTAFSMLEATGAKTLTELSVRKFDLLKCYLKADSDDKKFLKSYIIPEFFMDKKIRELFTSDMLNKEAKAVLKNSKKYALLEQKAKQRESKNKK